MDTNTTDRTQDTVVAFLSNPATFGPGVATVERQETHISHVFLGGDRALKLKRAVTYPYLDFSTVEKRKAACEAEVAINRRTAPGIYRAVVAVVRRRDGALALGGEGEVIDWVVDMARFDEAQLLDRLAQQGALGRRLMERLSDEIAVFHRNAEPRPRDDGHGSFVQTVEGNAATFAEFGPGILDMDRVADLTAALGQAIGEHAGLLDRRAQSGFVRHCHGDLHLRNIFLDATGRPVLFDAIEFNTLFAEIDVLYDVAFLWMDLEHRGLRRLANVSMNRYLDATATGAGEDGGIALVPMLLALRASIRAHVNATAAARSGDPTQASGLKAEAKSYLDLALASLAPPPPRLIATGGLSGSGKSRMARELAPLVGLAPGARVVRSDSLRKRIAGVGLLERLGPDGYGVDMTAQTYKAVYDTTRAVLRAGRSVIADAVFARPEQRAAIEAVAREEGVPFCGLWLEADPAIMAERAETRTANVSDAGADVVRLQLDYDLGEIGWARIDSSGTRAATLALGRAETGL